MRGLSGFLGALVWSGLVVGVGAVEARAAVRFLGESEGLATQHQMLDLPQEWLVTQNAQSNQAQRLFNEGYALYQEGTAASLQAAIEKFEAAIPPYQAANNSIGEALARVAAGSSYRDLGFNVEALDHYEKALKIWQRLTQQTTGEGLQSVRNVQAVTLNNIGTVYSSLGEKSRALEYFNQALPLRRAVGDRRGEATTLTSIGSVYDSIGEKSHALEYYNQALPLLRAVGDRGGEASTLTGIGNVYSSLGEKSRALEYYNQALPLLRAVGDRRGEATTLTSIGSVYDSIGEKSRALEYYNQALPLRRAVGDRGGEATTLNNIGLVYNSIGEKSRALEYYNQALPLRRAVGDRGGEATTLNNIGGVYESIGEKSRSLEYYNQALPLYQAVSDHGGEAVTLNNIGAVYDALGEKSRALEYYNQALPLLRAVGDISGESTTLGNVATVQRDQGQLTAALENIQAAIALIEQLRSNITSTELRQTYFAQQQTYYQFYTDLLMQLHQQNPNQGYDAQAFHISERSRARTLIELLTESQLNLRDTTENAQLQPLLDQEQTLLNQLTAQQQLLTQRLTNAQTEAEQTQIRQDYTTATQQINSELDRLITQIKRLNPAYTDLKYPDPLNLPQVQNQVLDDDTVLLQYSLHPDQSYLWLITKNGYETHILPPQAQIEQNATEFYQRIISSGDCTQAANPQACTQTILADIQTNGQALYNQILAPVANKIQGKRLLIVPDGALHYVPFAALPSRVSKIESGISKVESRVSKIESGVSEVEPPPFDFAQGSGYTPLVTQHEIIHAPSATAIATQRQNLANRPPAPKKLAIFADPVFSANDPRVTGATPTPTPQQNEPVSLQALLSRSALDRSLCLPNDGIQRLPGTRREAEALQKFAPDALTVLDFAANQDWFDRAPLHQYQTLFLSTHGCIDSQNPELSGLVLSLVDQNGQEKEDGFLRLNEIFGLDLNAELVVLSACQTGLGETIKGEGMIGMTRGFMYAGAKRVVVSLWNVNDNATAEFMSQFYAALENGTPAPQALREAQLTLWEKYQDPRLWAAFTLQGD